MSAGRLPGGGLEPSIPLLDVIDLSTRFVTDRGLVRAVDNISLTLDRGRTLGVVGESGSGKSVLLRSIMGLLPLKGVERSGVVKFENRDLARLRTRELRAVWGAEIGMVFQDPMTSLNPVTQVGPQVAESLRAHTDLSRSAAKARAIEILDSVGLPAAKHRYGEYPHQLSGGMRQRVIIAMALACGPKLLLADEPTTALDVTVQAQILDLLGRERAERDMAMILVTHDLGVVAGRTDEIMVMYAGRIVEHAPTKVLFSEMKMPYTEALVRSIPRLSARPEHSLSGIAGRPPNPVAQAKGCAFAPRCAYVQERCRIEIPPLRQGTTPDHQFACWYPVGTAKGASALAANQTSKSIVGVSRP